VSTITPTVDQLAYALGPGALLELIEIDGELIALVSVQDRLTLHELGPLARVTDELEWLAFALRRITRRQRGPQRATTLAGVQTSAQALGDMLLAPLEETLGDRSLVIVPTASLQALPWSILPPLRGRPVVVAPSAVIWLARRAAPRRRQPKRVLVAGPRLRHAVREIKAIRALYPDAEALTGSAATATAVLRALDGATVAHLACHGRFRADSPLFSSLELADGPLNAYELQRLDRAPELIVLSACDLATSTAQAGDELLGLAAALIAMGTRTIIASVLPVPDALAQKVTVTLHRQLAAGESAAQALAHVQATLPSSQVALAGFVCLGVG
jgi:CHAT domain-containing protein